MQTPLTWDDLILPEKTKETLQQILNSARARFRVYHQWGLTQKRPRGLGLCALFSGYSGTGKTTAAEIIAQELNLDCYRVDLSNIVSKYIGETEKNLKRIFDAAEGGGVVLLFDEADALFGKRGEIKEARDRYANQEVSYLLQRIETYPGLTILTTNLKQAIDEAFERRFKFIVDFPKPDYWQRQEMWERMFPLETPTQGLDFDLLPKLNVSGGNLANVALEAAFRAAAEEEAIQMKHILAAAKADAQRTGRQMHKSETEGWI
ncbi:ATP-binding protein [Baaleninema simplex]|uniref:ATP-binding protein n=1 Tax=Baaleninema simplex TaxID=2862350 RepID=UPI000348D9F3|nr:ATP-binding protein [Baaleninema simplex]